MSYKISSTLCPQDHECPIISLCPMEAISQQGNGLPVIDDAKCIECGVCEMICPSKAVTKEIV